MTLNHNFTIHPSSYIHPFSKTSLSPPLSSHCSSLIVVVVVVVMAIMVAVVILNFQASQYTCDNNKIHQMNMINNKTKKEP